MIKLKNIVLYFSALVFIALSSCDNEACKENMYTSMNMSFYSRGETSQAASLDSFSVYGVSENGSLKSIGYDDTFGISSLNLVLDPNQSYTKFFIKSSVLRDTIVVLHTNTIEFVSAECGARNVFKIDSVYFSSGHAEDSISISNPMVNGNYNAKNVKIYM